MKSFLNNLFLLRFLSNFPKVILIPYFAVWLIHFENFSPAQAGVIVGSYIITYRAGALFFSWLTSQHHPKKILICNLALLGILQTLLFVLGVYNIHYFLWWIITSLLLGSAISIISNLILSYIGSLKDSSQHVILFSYLNMAFNLSSGIGPVLGGIILHAFPQYLPLAPCFFIIIALWLSFNLPDLETHERREGQPYGYIKLFANTSLLKFIIISSISFLGYACFYDLFPLYSHKVYALPTIGLFFLITCFIIVLFQIPIKKLILERTSKRYALLIAHLLLAASVLLLFFGGKGHIAITLVGLVCLSFSEMIFLPIYQAQTLILAGPANSVYAMALLSALWGVTEAIAASSGTYLIAHHFALPFYISCTIFSVLTAVYFFLTE